ncbi:MAG: FEA1-related lipoprotein [Candidatus Thermoplasmatota archaeon]|nr:FEA1-related lipoprotein [Candidatus Thermoplasmatota archaeon]
MNSTSKSLILTILMIASTMAGCLGGDEGDVDLDGEDGGYTYASNVDNHRMLMGDVCDIKDLSGAYDWDGVKTIYEEGEYAKKSDGSYRTLMGFADAAGKNHAYDGYYGADGSWNDFVSAAIDGTGPFAGESDTVRDQAVEKGIQNGVMTAYAIHELNAAIIKAEAGNWGPDDAQHAWDEGWAFYHGPDDDGADFDGCGPYATADKRADNFGTTDGSGTAQANVATLSAMNDGLTAMQNEDMDGLISARDEVLKNVVIVYSQASVRYASKMTDDLAADDKADYDKHQAEGHAFFRVIEAYIADHTDACYNNQTHGMAYIGARAATTCDAFVWMDYQGTMVCYNTVVHMVFAEGTTEEICNGFASTFPGSNMPGYYPDYGASKIIEIFDLKNDGDSTADYEADVRMYLQPAWNALSITSDDIGQLV